MFHRFKLLTNGFGIIALVYLLSACGGRAQISALPPTKNLVAVSLVETRLNNSDTCTNSFSTHPLEHTTRVHGNQVHLFESNGAGVAVNDLDDDGLLDIVFANLNGPATIFWNLGNLSFRQEPFADQDTRAVNLVDVNGDGELDLVFTHTTSGISYWRNTSKDVETGRTNFALTALPNVGKPAHAMAWGDLNGDGQLDLVAASYDAELNLESGNTFLFSDGAGVYVYMQHDKTFVPQRLADESQAMAISLYDLNDDQRPDIWVGNDFEMRDQIWMQDASRWNASSLFPVMSESTMGFDAADIDNDGSMEFFSTDMKPYDISVKTMAEWLPMMARMPQVHAADDPQTMQNVLLQRGADGSYRDVAMERGVSATGWSWSAKFGDLDNDGWLDLYVVNGMIARELFKYLPGDALVEENQALKNDGHGNFNIAPHWGLGSTASGRGMTMADFNNDGKLDIVVNNLQAPAQLFENQICGGSALQVDLRSSSGNTRELGAKLILHTSAGTFTRDVRSGSGYLSGDPSRVHFGIPKDATLTQLEILWSNGTVSRVDKLNANTLLTITR